MNEIMIPAEVTDHNLWPPHTKLRITVQYENANIFSSLTFIVPNSAHAKARWAIGSKATITITPNMPTFPAPTPQKPEHRHPGDPHA